MAILVRTIVTGLDTATYDQISSKLEPEVKKQPGFILHVAFPTDKGMAVSELWESRDQYDKWFNENVKPNVQGEMSSEFIDVHHIVKP